MQAPEQSFAEFRRTGSAAALGRAFDATAPELLRIATFLAPRAEIEDLVQDTFVVALRKREHWQASERLLPWLLGILANEARTRRRRRRLLARELAGPAPAAAPDPLVAAAAREIEAAFEAALLRLAHGEAELLRLHLRQELSCREIGERLGRPAGTVRTQMARAMSALRARLPAGLGAVAVLPPAPTAVLPALRERVLEAAASMPPPVHGEPSTVADAPLAPAASRSLRTRFIAGAAIAAVSVLAVAAAQLWPQPSPSAAPATPPGAPPAVAASPAAPPAEGPQRIAAAVPPPAAVPAPRWVLRGKVADEAGAPIAGATVTAYLREFGPQLAQAAAGADGRYEVDLGFWRGRSPLDRGAYGIVAIARAPGTNNYTFLQSFPADADPRRELIVEHDFELSPYATLRGRVVDARGQGVPAHVNAFEIDGGHSLVDTTDAGADGSFRIVAATDSARVELDARHPTGGRCKLTVELRPGADVDAGVVVLEPGLPIGGRVTLADGTPLADWPVNVRGDADGYWYFEARTNADGVYAANRPAACPWRVFAAGFVGRNGADDTEMEVAADVCRQDLVVPGVLLHFRCFDADGRELLPQPLQVHVFAAGDAASARAAEAGSEEAFARAIGSSFQREPMIVPGGAHVLVRGTGSGGLGVASRLTAPAAGVLEVPLHFAPAPAATLTVRARFADGGTPTAIRCHIDPGAGASPRAVEDLGRGAGEVRLRCPVGALTVHVSAYPDAYDDAEETVQVSTTADGEHTVELVLARRGTFAFVLRDAAEPARVCVDDVAARVTAGEVGIGRFRYRQDDLLMWSSEPPIGLRAAPQTLLPVGRRRVTFAVEGYEPVTVEVDVRELEAAAAAGGDAAAVGGPAVEVLLPKPR